MKNFFKILIIFIVSIIAVCLVYTMFQEQTMSPYSAFFNTVEITGHTLNIHGVVDATASGFRGYRYSIKDKTLILTIKDVNIFSLLRNKVGPGDIDITITDDNISEINKIYLLDDDNYYLVWNESEGIKRSPFDIIKKSQIYK
ncbi:hypothetical protein [Anaerovorax odorimutans]|uniref:hypothetical protein n=1 Tax=Anaerovorax odorimutans TaxID=109327 RepID=UPI0004865FFA|nr:hypothetical protein [Anaerovorax odorimutans]